MQWQLTNLVDIFLLLKFSFLTEDIKKWENHIEFLLPAQFIKFPSERFQQFTVFFANGPTGLWPFFKKRLFLQCRPGQR